MKLCEWGRSERKTHGTAAAAAAVATAAAVTRLIVADVSFSMYIVVVVAVAIGVAIMLSDLGVLVAVVGVVVIVVRSFRFRCCCWCCCHCWVVVAAAVSLPALPVRASVESAPQPDLPARATCQHARPLAIRSMAQAIRSISVHVIFLLSIYLSALDFGMASSDEESSVGRKREEHELALRATSGSSAASLLVDAESCASCVLSEVEDGDSASCSSCSISEGDGNSLCGTSACDGPSDDRRCGGISPHAPPCLLCQLGLW